MTTYTPVAAAEVTAHIARHAAGRGEDAGLDEQKVHNLLFLCQGYSLAAHGAPLFAEQMLAAPGGVSCPAATMPCNHDDFVNVPDEVREVVAHVWDTFGGLTPQKLQARVGRHVTCVQEMNGGGTNLSKSTDAIQRAFALAVQQGMM